MERRTAPGSGAEMSTAQTNAGIKDAHLKWPKSITLQKKAVVSLENEELMLEKFF